MMYMSTKPADPEYEMLRTEMLQYMEEYQTVRNMMYIATASIFGLNGTLWDNYYLFLFPLAVILPSYLIYYDYWKCVSRDSTYMQVFLEDESTSQSSYHWESRHYKFRLLESEKLKNRKIYVIAHFQQIPYVVCGLLCLILYFVNMFGKYAILKAQEALDIRIVIIDVILGVVLTILSIFIFAKFWNLDSKEFMLIWKQIKEAEMRRK